MSTDQSVSELSDDEMGELEASAGRGAAPRRAQHFWPTLRRMGGLLRGETLGITLAILMVAGSVVLNVAAPLVLGQAMNVLFVGATGHEATGQGANLTGPFDLAPDLDPSAGIDFLLLGRLILIVMCMYLVANALTLGQELVLNRVGMRIIFQLREDIEYKLNRLPLGWSDVRQRGDILSRTTNDVDNVQQAIQQSVPSIINGVLTLLGIAIMMFTISWQLALIALIAIPLAVIVVSFIGRKSQRLFATQWKHTGRLNGHVEESFTGHDVIKLFGREELMEEKFTQRNDQLYEASYKAQFYSGIIYPIMQVVTQLGFVGIAVVGGLRVAGGTMSLGAVTAFIQYSREFNQPLGELTGLANIVISAVASAERIFELTDAEEEENPAADSPLQERLNSTEPGPHRSTEISNADGLRGSVEFEHVKFSYVPEKPLITDLNMKAEPGQMIAIVGPSGAGKTTLVNLITRFYELNAGTIRLDGIDISTMDRADLRSRIGMVLQDAVLFTGSIADNIRYGHLGATDEEVKAAARATYVDRFVNHLPDGYDTQVSIDSDAISAGERQLITIARVFLLDPSLLILDEATSSVDTRTEQHIQEALASLQEDRTTFVIAHRLSTIRQADTILMMVDGDLVEQGSHDELMAARGPYYDLYLSQYSSGKEPETALPDADS